MAKITNNEELRQQALRTLAEGRAEINAEVHRLRQQLSPAQVMHRVADRHPSLVMFLAFAAGIVPALFIFRNKRPPGRVRPPVTVTVSKAQPKPMAVTLLTAALGIFVKTIAPALVRSAITPHRSADRHSGR